MSENKEIKDVLDEEPQEDENGDNKSEKKASTVVIVDENSEILFGKGSVLLRVSYDFVRVWLGEEYKNLSNEELMGKLQKLSDVERHELFAAGIKKLTIEKKEEFLKKFKESTKETETQEPGTPGNNRQIIEEKPQDEPKKKKWWLVPVVIFLTTISLAGCPKKYPPLTPSEVVEEVDKETPEEDEKIPQSRSDVIELYVPNDGSTSFKANTDYGNQEMASNDRKGGIISDGQEEYDGEKNVMEKYEANKDKVKFLKECCDILSSDTATLEEKRDTLRNMRDPAIDLADSFDEDEMNQILRWAMQESERYEDSLTEGEEEIAKMQVEEYKLQADLMAHNVRVLFYVDYLEKSGYSITDIKISKNHRGDLTLAIDSDRVVPKSQAETGEKTFDQYEEALAEWKNKNPDKSVIEFNNALVKQEKTFSEKAPALENNSLNNFSKMDFEEVLKDQDPNKVNNAIDDLINELIELKISIAPGNDGNVDLIAQIPDDKEGGEDR